MPRGCWRRTSNTPLGRGSICSPGKIDELEKRLADARQAGQLPALARLGRRTAEQKRLARYRRPHLPADSATGAALWQGEGWNGGSGIGGNGKAVQAVQIDIAKFNIWLTNTAVNNGGSTYNNTCQLSSHK